MKYGFLGAFVLLLSCIVGCAPVTSEESYNKQNSDHKNFYISSVEGDLSLQQAIDIAIKNNLDAKIAEQDYIVSLSDAQLQKFNSLPTITAKRDFLKRNNFAASSSVSAETGVESLEPSISSDRSSRITALDLNWNLVDAAINIYRASSSDNQSQIAEERYRKVLQNIVLDTQNAFYKLAIHQKYEGNISQLLGASEVKISELNKAKQNGDINYDRIDDLVSTIYGHRSELLELQKLGRLAEIELKALLSVSPKEKITVETSFLSSVSPQSISPRKGIDHYVTHALNNRPEIKEEFLNLKVAERNINIEVLSSIPGFSIFAASNQDDNSFLEENDWFNLTATLSQSITSLLTLPVRLQKAKREVDLVNSRRNALVAAVIFQVNIAYVGWGDTYSDFVEGRRVFDLKRDSRNRKTIMAANGLISGLQNFINTSQYQIDEIEFKRKHVELLMAHERLKHSTGGFPYSDSAYKSAEATVTDG